MDESKSMMNSGAFCLSWDDDKTDHGISIYKAMDNPHTMIKKLEKTLMFWGIFDILAIFWYISWNIFQKRIPFLFDIRELARSTASLGVAWVIVLSVFGLVVYLSLAVTGYLLIKQKKTGVIIAYIQTPFRLIMVIPPSIFFILWPLSFITETPNVIFGYSLILILEFMKIVSLILWQVSVNKRQDFV